MTDPTARRRRAPHRVLAGLLVPLLGLAVTACGGTTTDAGGSAAPSTAASTGAAPAFTPATSGTLRLYTWSDYIPQSLVDRFSKETGIRMSVDYYDSNETLEAKLKASGGKGYDLVVPSDYMVQTLRTQNLLQEVDLEVSSHSIIVQNKGKRAKVATVVVARHGDRSSWEWAGVAQATAR